MSHDPDSAPADEAAPDDAAAQPPADPGSEEPSAPADAEGETSAPADAEGETSAADAERGDPAATGERAGDADRPRIDEGRYVYCVVRVPGDEPPSDGAIDERGIDDEPVSVVTADGIGAVVHACDGLYDSADPVEIRRWLVRHQTVVDAAADAFGTPLPFQFDTVVRGDDEAVREWLRSERETLDAALDALAGHWEYRIEVVRTDPLADEALVEGDDRLAALREEIEAADRGRAHLLEKRYESRLRERRRERRELLTAEVRDRLAPHVREVHALEREPAAAIDGAGESSDGADPSGDVDRSSDAESAEIERVDGETVCRLTVLAHEDDEDAVGAALDEVAAEDGIAVRFTGPWPPYTFTPAFGDGDAAEAASENGDAAEAASENGDAPEGG